MEAPGGLCKAILNGGARTASAELEAALAGGADPAALISHDMIPAMDEGGSDSNGGKANA